jgi:hypothetical protein
LRGRLTWIGISAGRLAKLGHRVLPAAASGVSPCPLHGVSTFGGAERSQARISPITSGWQPTDQSCLGRPDSAVLGVLCSRRSTASGIGHRLAAGRGLPGAAASAASDTTASGQPETTWLPHLGSQHDRAQVSIGSHRVHRASCVPGCQLLNAGPIPATREPSQDAASQREAPDPSISLVRRTRPRGLERCGRRARPRP